MTLILTALALVFIIIKYLIFIDIILSWLSLVGLKVRPEFISSILDPLYIGIKGKVPTTIGPLDFTPIVILIFMELLVMFIYGLDSDVPRLINNLTTIL
ncbi:YggT family protein [Candidatus Gracilibacteria bacterium]|nr:YggT family protein [Candidatus Gracilibacteria bacterium]